MCRLNFWWFFVCLLCYPLLAAPGIFSRCWFGNLLILLVGIRRRLLMCSFYTVCLLIFNKTSTPVVSRILYLISLRPKNETQQSARQCTKKRIHHILWTWANILKYECQKCNNNTRSLSTSFVLILSRSVSWGAQTKSRTCANILPSSSEPSEKLIWFLDMIIWRPTIKRTGKKFINSRETV